MSGEDAEFLSRVKVSEFRNLVNKHVNQDRPISTQGRRFTAIEKAEMLESLGILEFHEGNWHQAVQCFKQSLTEYAEVTDRRSPEQFVASFILVCVLFMIYKRLFNYFNINWACFIVWNESI